MPKTTLTNKHAIARLPKPEKGQKLYWDTKLTGFGVLVSGKTGARSFVVQREVNGHTRRVKICTLAELEATKDTVENVRAKASRLLQEMRDGVDPKRHRGPEANVTLQEVLDLYIKSNTSLAERTRTGYRNSIQRWIGDWLDKPLREITETMVEERFHKITDSVKARVGNGERPNRSADPGASSANAVMRALRALWNFAADGRVPELPTKNPVARLKRSWHSIPPRERYVSGDQLPAFYKAVVALESRTMREYLLLLLFTGLRRNEAAGLEWANIDFTQKIIRLPARRTKAKRKLDLPMSDFVHDLLVARRALGFENDFVFPADSQTGHLAEPKKALAEVGEACGIHVSPHDLRRTFITVASNCHIAPQALKALVNHALGGDVTEGYNQLTTADLSESMQIVTDRMKELCGVQPVAGENVTRLPSA